MKADAILFDLLNVSLLAMMVVLAMFISRHRGLFGVAMLTGLYSLLSACVFVLLDAVDVAFTEAAVGAGMTTVLFLGTFGLTRSREAVTPGERSVPAAIVSIAAGLVLAYAFLDLPEFGAPDTPVQTHPLAERYLNSTEADIGIPNTVTNVLASYRGYDTLGETVVVFTAGMAVLMLLGRAAREREPDQDEREVD